MYMFWVVWSATNPAGTTSRMRLCPARHDASRPSTSAMVTRVDGEACTYIMWDGRSGTLTWKLLLPPPPPPPAFPTAVPPVSAAVRKAVEDTSKRRLRNASFELGEEDGFDAAQDASLAALQHQGPDPDNPHAYVMGVQRHKTLDALDSPVRRRARKASDLDAVIEEDPDVGRREENDPSQRLAMGELAEKVRKELAKLPYGTRVALVLMQAHELTSTEIKLLTGIAATAIRQACKRGLDDLRSRRDAG
jgi:DNA-directed RNA polymerase specialized sigma24 family protein